MKRLSALDIYLRTGRPAAEPEPVEIKFNPNHDEAGRFTFSDQGVGPGAGTTVLRTMGLPVTGNPNPHPDRQARPKPAQAARPPQRPPAAQKLKPILGYSDTGVHSWRSANDQVFVDAANKFNKERGLKPGDLKYVDPQFIKAWATVESGGNKEAFMRDPLQVNNPGDFKDPKPRVTGLAKHQQMTPAVSVEAALKWLEYKGSLRGS